MISGLSTTPIPKKVPRFVPGRIFRRWAFRKPESPTQLATMAGIPSLKLHGRPWKSTILMVFTRKDGDFHGRAVSFREGRSFTIFLVRVLSSSNPFWNGGFRRLPGENFPKQVCQELKQRSAKLASWGCPFATCFFWKFWRKQRFLRKRNGAFVNGSKYLCFFYFLLHRGIQTKPF